MCCSGSVGILGSLVIEAQARRPLSMYAVAFVPALLGSCAQNLG